jgi:hypothetical protein
MLRVNDYKGFLQAQWTKSVSSSANFHSGGSATLPRKRFKQGPDFSGESQASGLRRFGGVEGWSD